MSSIVSILRVSVITHQPIPYATGSRAAYIQHRYGSIEAGSSFAAAQRTGAKGVLPGAVNLIGAVVGAAIGWSIPVSTSPSLAYYQYADHPYRKRQRNGAIVHEWVGHRRILNIIPSMQIHYRVQLHTTTLCLHLWFE